MPNKILNTLFTSALNTHEYLDDSYFYVFVGNVQMASAILNKDITYKINIHKQITSISIDDDTYEYYESFLEKGFRSVKQNYIKDS